MGKRTLEQALAHAEGVRHYDLPVDEFQVLIQRNLLAELHADLVLLADEVAHLRRKTLGQESAYEYLKGAVLQIMSDPHRFVEVCSSCRQPLPHDGSSHVHIAKQGCDWCGRPNDDSIHHYNKKVVDCILCGSQHPVAASLGGVSYICCPKFIAPEGVFLNIDALRTTLEAMGYQLKKG